MSKITEAQKENQENKNQLIKFMKDNSGWIIGSLTFLGLILLKTLELIEHLISKFYFLYYGLEHNLYNYSDKGFIYELIISILYLLVIFSIIISFKQIKDKIKNKKIFNFENFGNIVIITIANILIDINIYNRINIYEVTLFIITEILVLLITLKGFEKIEEKELDNEQIKKYFLNYLKVLPYFLIILIVSKSMTTSFKLKNDKNYYIINNDKVIVYSTKDYFLTLDCEILNGNELKIYKGQQEKIDNNNVKTELIEFDKVEIIDQTKQQN